MRQYVYADAIQHPIRILHKPTNSLFMLTIGALSVQFHAHRIRWAMRNVLSCPEQQIERRIIFFHINLMKSFK